jgi:2-polyprenyl-3-methyl-5-hydroxy-6-metoxy-1,4-benzoquinol methylase
MDHCTELTECLACGGTNLELTLNLNNQPLANSFQVEPGTNQEYPLAVNRCTACCHLQLTHIVDPEIIYKDYAYVSGTSQTYLDYMRWFARWAREYSDHWHGTVLDIGCNDGSQLDEFRSIGFNTYGVDPAENLHETSKSKGHKVVCGFWNKKSIEKLKHDRFDIIVAQNSFAHNPDPVKYLKLLEPLMGKKSLFFIQTSQADMVRNGEFDTIYHEHVNFYNINSMYELARRAGMYLVDVVKTPIHGTSYIFVLSTHNLKPKHVKNLLAMEEDLMEPATYTKWAEGSTKIVAELARHCEEFKKMGYRLVGYGAAAKGMTLLNYADITLDCIIDDNPLKQGSYSPGKDIPIVSIKHLDDYQDDKIVFVPLAWNFYKEIKNKILDYRVNDNDRFLRYFPEVSFEH